MSVSGGARAAEQLSAALLPHCDIRVASMMDSAGGSVVPHLPVSTWLPRGLPWSRMPRHFSTLFYRSNLPDLVATTDSDLIHLHNPMPALEMARVARACLARNLPFVVSTHGFNEVANGVEVYGFGRARREIWRHLVLEPVRYVVRNASAIFALSPADVPIVRAMGFRGDPVLVCNGVARPAPANPTHDSATLGRLGIAARHAAGPLTCMFLANHTPNKGLPVLLEAFANLDLPYLLIIGGEKRPSIAYSDFMARCRPDQQIVVTDRLSDQDVAALFRRSDLFVFPTLADTFPLAVLEAMSHGLPVLASRIGGIPYQIDQGCGVLVEPGSPDALADAVKALAASPDRLAAMGQAARERVRSDFTWQRTAERALEGYRRVLGQGQ
jgi:glycosyltransferase involved in cell wall biosynthesis